MKTYIAGVIIITLLFLAVAGSAQNNNGEIFYYKKSEKNLGFKYYGNENREELKTDSSNCFEELASGSIQFYFTNRYWNFLDFKQEQFQFTFETGPLWGNGNWIDSSSVENIMADHKIIGVRTNAAIGYSNRYYWDRTNFTIVDISAWGRYDLIQVKSEGTRIDSLFQSFPYDETEKSKKLRYGFQAKAGWGIGRLNPMNNYMMADYLLNKFYAGRNFSESEIVQVADEIGRIKAERTTVKKRETEKETAELEAFISKTMFLELPEDLHSDWPHGEFLPRFNGMRVEAGPFFKYFNREPDFVYGAYFQFKTLKYKSVKWNRNFSANIAYNGYKRNDWILAEFDYGWLYYPNLKDQWNFGLKYVPGTVVDNFKNLESVKHGFIPYFGYFTQLNSTIRVEADASLRIANNEQFMLAGPEFSLKFYWSKY